MTTNIVTGFKLENRCLCPCVVHSGLSGHNKPSCKVFADYFLYIHKNHSFAYPCYYSSLALFPGKAKREGKKE